MGWLDDLAKQIESKAEETASDIGKIVDRALGWPDK